MPRNDDRDRSAPRPGPYEAQYQVLRGYDVPAPVHVRTHERAPVLIARRREEDRT